MAEPGASTRLIVLGCVRIFQPVHGYFVRRELTSWQVDQWANTHPGSIYAALRTLTRDGLLEEVTTTPPSGRPTRTSYRLTPTGEREFFGLLRRNLLTTDDTASFLAALNLSVALPRDEVVRALRARTAILEGELAQGSAFVAELLAAPDTPDHASEIPRFLSARTQGELAWLRDLVARIESGSYSYAGEQPDWEPTEDAVAQIVAAGVGDAAVLVAPPDAGGTQTRNKRVDA